jgi:hypothetical protein
MRRASEAMGTIKEVDKTNNEVNVLYPKRSRWGVWSFTDLEVGLFSEPFVGAINTMIDLFTDGKDECIVYISSNPLPEANGHLIRVEGKEGGWYTLEGTDIEGWLCPATLNYFPDYPDNIYFKIELIKE